MGSRQTRFYEVEQFLIIISSFGKRCMNNILRAIIRIMIPLSLREKMRAYFREGDRQGREAMEKQIPKVPLTKKHMQNCQLLLNRTELLSNIKKGGVVAEIGVDRGDFSELILNLAEPSLLHLIDVWDSERYNNDLFESVRSNFENLIAKGRVQVHRKLSTGAVEDFPNDYFDWIYIDSDHSYKVTRDELRKYASKVKNDGIIAGHDYSIGNWVCSYRYGVIEAVHEFCVEQGWELVYLTLDPIELQSFAIRRIQK